MSKDKYVLSSKLSDSLTPRLSLGQYMLNCLRSNGDNVAQINAATGETLNYREILEQSIQLAESLKNRGLKIGDRVAFSSENRLNLIIPALASYYLGAALAPLNPAYTKAEIQHALGISKPTFIFVSPLVEDLVREAVSELDLKLQFIQLSSEQNSKDVPTMAEVIAESEQFYDLNAYTPVEIFDYKKHVAVILCSSGTTGLPKGVMLSHYNVMTLLQHFNRTDFVNLRPDRPLLLLVPFFHGYGFSLTLGLAANKGLAIMMSAFDPMIFLEAIQKYKVAIVPIVPAIMVFLAKHPIVDKFDLSSVQEIICGAAPLSSQIESAVMKRLRIPAIRQGYGMTEHTVIASVSPTINNKVGSSGILSPDTKCKVVDIKTSEPLGPGQLGEIWLRGDLVMIGYCDDPKATSETIDKDGWLHTGDIGYYDQDGFIFIVDRLKELIKYKGFQVAPAELEAILLNHPAVKDAAVIGLPNENDGEVPMAFVVREPGVEVSSQEIQKFVADKVSPQKWLRGGVRFLEDIPKNPSGKILRRELRQLLPKF